MSDQTKFKHIKVNSDIDDDVVIYAGQPRLKHHNSDELQSASTEGHVVVQIEDRGDVPDAAQIKTQSKTQTQTSSQASEREGVQQQAHEHGQARAERQERAQGSGASKDSAEYHGTTLADIEGSKMPKAQIITIVLALIAIGAFVIWYIVAM